MSEVIKAIAQAKRIAFQGEPGAYANLAARQAIPHATAIPKPTFEDAIEAAKSGDTDLVIIPVENSLIGRIADIHHLLPQSGLHIVGEHFMPIRHQLLGLKGASLDGIKSVYSQAPALAQCSARSRRKTSARVLHEAAARQEQLPSTISTLVVVMGAPPSCGRRRYPEGDVDVIEVRARVVDPGLPDRLCLSLKLGIEARQELAADAPDGARGHNAFGGPARSHQGIDA